MRARVRQADQGDLFGDEAPTRLAPIRHETVTGKPVHEVAIYCLQRGTGRLKGRERSFLQRIARGGDFVSPRPMLRN